MEIDHLAVTCASLDEGVAHVEALLGVPLAPGGRHARFATRNRLLSLGPGLYLEVIAPDPDAPPPAHPRWFGIDDAGAPGLRNWIVRVPDIAHALMGGPEGAGEPLSLSRGDLTWIVAVPPDGGMPLGGAYPTLIQWGQGAHPSAGLPDHGVRLLELEVGHPRSPRLRGLLADLADPRLRIVTADAPILRARLATPGGEVWL